MTRSLRWALVAWALFGVGCGGGALDAPGAGSGGATQIPPVGSGGTVGSGGNAPPVEDAGAGGTTDATPTPTPTPPTDGGPVSGWDSSAADPGTDGDGIRMLSGPYRAAPEFTRGAGVPAGDRKSTRLNSSHPSKSRMPSSA